MSSKEKENPLSFSKLKNFFRRVPGTTPRIDFALNPDIEKELHPESPVAQRCKALREMGDVVLNNRLEDASIQTLWELTKDLILPHRPVEHRHLVFAFYQKLIQGQFEGLSIMRDHFFRVVQTHEIPEDIGNRLDLFKTLTDNGKNITFFEERVGSFMLQWLPAIVEAGLTECYLEVLVNVIKFNAAYLEKTVIVGIIQNACYLSCYIDDPKTVLQCLAILDAALCYTVFPTETLSLCIVSLCRTVNREAYCQTSWKIMKNLLGTNMGYAALVTMCNILNDSAMYSDEALLRGAVFHINMGLWGSTGSVVPSLKCSPSTVLLSFLHALGSKRIIVTYEVILSIQRLIKMSGQQISEPSWDVICDILYAISGNIKYYEKTNNLPKDHIVQSSFHETLNIIEVMLQKFEIAANPDNFYALIESVSDDRSEPSVLNLIDYMSMKISATKPEWLQLMYKFVERFYKMSNINIRIKTIQVLIHLMDINRAAYEDEILERVVMPHFSNIHLEPEIAVRTAVGKMLIEFSKHCDTKRCLELLDVLEKLLNRPFDLHDAKATLKTDADVQDVVAITDGLIEIFILKLYRLPATHPIKLFHMLIGHLEKCYHTPVLLECTATIRSKIFNWMLKARANSTFHIGFPDSSKNGAIRFSYYLGIDYHAPFLPQAPQPQMDSMEQQQQQQQLEQQQNAPPPAVVPSQQSEMSFTSATISIRRGCKRIVECLQVEPDWNITQLVLKELPNILQNKALLLGNDMDKLANTLVGMYFAKHSPSANKPSLSDSHVMILPAIASLLPYHQYLGQGTIKEIINVLSKGFFSRNQRVSVHAFTLMLLEMPDLMLRHLPDILLEMSKMSTTVSVAVPVLEFLSTLNRLPSRRFANFVVVQYMYVFAISVPYTNPYKYDHYTVSLAHHVIAGWFLKCRLPLRRNFVNYVIKGFETNVQIPFQEIKKMDFSQNNEDSSNRKRSSSLTEQGSRRREQPSLQQLQTRPKQDDAMFNFHMELAETCIDFLARHTFSPCSALPKRLPSSEFILAGGQAMTWLVGHNLITITTSGCTSVQLKNGLCDRCSLLCKTPLKPNTSSSSHASGINPTSPDPLSAKTDSDSMNKRYTKASLLHTNGQESGSTDITSSTSSSTPFSAHHVTPDSGKFFRETSNDGRFSTSSGSLEALSRRGSNPDTPDAINNNHNTVDRNENQSRLSQNAYVSPQSLSSAELRTKQICACSCTGWAEVCIRRPTGNMSWVMRIQNQVSLDTPINELPLHDIINLFMPSLGGVLGSEFLNDSSLNSSSLYSPDTGLATTADSSCNVAAAAAAATDVKRKISASSEMSADSKTHDDELNKETMAKPSVANTTSHAGGGGAATTTASSGPIDIPKQTQPAKESAGSFSDIEDEQGDDDNPDVPFDDDDSRSRNPVRRVNSSPEMSSNWRIPFKGPQASNAANNPNNQGTMPEEEAMNSGEFEQQQKKKSFGKDMRVSCEAIPEEIAGSTPPSQPESVKESEGNIKTIMSPMKTQPTAVTAKLPSVATTKAFPATTAAAPVAPYQLSDAIAATSSSASAIASAAAAATAVQPAPPKKQLSADDASVLSPTVEPYPLSGSSTFSGTTQPTSGILTTQSVSSSHKLKIPMDMPKITTKPPQSPVPLSPRLLAKNAANKIAPFGGGGGGGTMTSGAGGFGGSGNGSNAGNSGNGGGGGGYDMIRGRSKTISVVREHDNRDSLKWNNFRPARSGISPSAVFLQLYHTGPNQSSEHPIQIGPTNTKAITLLDLIPPFETHKIGVVYVGRGQCHNETDIFKNRFGSLRYTEFLRNIGTLVALKDAKEHNLFVNMETNGRDGNFTYIWQDDIVQVTFHVATLMPNKEQDPHCHEKKKHIGNDFVTIVYNESGEEYNINTIKGQFNYACVVVEPIELNSNRIFVRTKEDVAKYINHSDAKIVSDSSAPLFARQLALHANLASLVARSLKTKNQSPYASNWLERLRKIKHLRAKLLKENNSSNPENSQTNYSSSSSGGASGSNNNSSSNSNTAAANTQSGQSAASQWLKEDFTSYT